MSTRLCIAAAVALSAMGCDVVTPTALDGGDGGVDPVDATVDSLSPIDPTAPAVGGEGDECAFSFECEPLQVCVDDACVRRERLDTARITWGELRRAPLDELLAQVGESLPRPWNVLREGEVHPRPRSSIMAARGGATLAFTVDHPTSCPLVFVGARVRTGWIDGLRCTAMALDEDDGVWAAGVDSETGTPVVVRIDEEGVELARHDVAESLDPAIGAATSWGGIAGPITSLLWFDGALYLSMRPGRGGDRSVSTLPQDEIEVVFARVDRDGSARLLDLDGRQVFAGSEAGWLVPNADGSPAALLVQRDVTSFETPVTLDLVQLQDGSRETWLDDWALDIRPSVWAPGVIDVLVKNEPQCAFTVVRHPTRTSSHYNATACGAGGGYRVSTRPRDYDVPEPSLPVALEHSAYGMVRTQWETLSTDEGVMIELFGRDLEPSRMDWYSRPLDGAYDNVVTTAVSRHEMTVEGALGFFASGPAFEWFELAMSYGAAE